MGAAIWLWVVMAAAVDSGVAFVQAERVTLREAPRETAAALAELPIGSRVSLHGAANGAWCKVGHDKVVGFLRCKDVGAAFPDATALLRQVEDVRVDPEHRLMLAGRVLVLLREDEAVERVYRKTFYAAHAARLEAARRAGKTRPGKPASTAWDVAPYVMEQVYNKDPRFSGGMWVGGGSEGALVGVVAVYGVFHVVMGKLVAINADGDAGYVEELVTPVQFPAHVARVLFASGAGEDRNAIYPERRAMGLGCLEPLEERDGMGSCNVGAQDQYVGCADLSAQCSDGCARTCGGCAAAAPRSCQQCQAACGGKPACLGDCATAYAQAYAKCTSGVRDCLQGCNASHAACVREKPLFEQQHCSASCQPMLTCRVEKCGGVQRDCLECPKPSGCWCSNGQ